MTTRDDIIDWISQRAPEMSDFETSRAADFYVRHRIIKIDRVTGGWTLVHGQFSEPDLLRKAATIVE